jgi:hypothetical protein
MGKGTGGCLVTNKRWFPFGWLVSRFGRYVEEGNAY